MRDGAKVEEVWWQDGLLLPVLPALIFAPVSKWPRRYRLALA